jgi:hypothetical protein
MHTWHASSRGMKFASWAIAIGIFGSWQYWDSKKSFDDRSAQIWNKKILQKKPSKEAKD